MPNMIGFQSVLHGICSRLGAPERKASIIVDQQSQFNTTQRELNEFTTRYGYAPGTGARITCYEHEKYAG